MTATDELRRLLDKCGVEWWPLDGTPDMTECIVNGVRHKYRPVGGGIIWSSCTEVAMKPEQAIAATLGAGTCRLTDNGPWGYPYVCSACGASFDADVNGGDFNFCPNCGARVEDE